MIDLPRWPHQLYGVNEVIRLIGEGERRICLTSPTGGGKTQMMIDLIAWATAQGFQTILYTNRKLLIEQLIGVATKAGMDHGVRAADYIPQFEKTVQIASIQTEHSRTVKRETWNLSQARVVFVDEAHLQKGEMATELIRRHDEGGASTIGVTATPLDLGGMYTKLVQAGVTSELRKCGALLLCHHYGPDEPDMKNFKPKTKTGEYSEGDIRKAIMTPTIFSRVYENWQLLNPDARPAILFAPGVKESIWFAEQYLSKGIRAAHIDGENCWIDGKAYKTSPQARADIIAGSKDGTIKVVCNRFVLREGIDMPWLFHGIFATVFASIQSFLQSGGRLLRSHPSLDHVVLQDHGGCLDSETEILTKRGWKGRTTIADDDMVAGYDRDTCEISWQPILSRHDRPLEPGEKMFAAVGRSCDIRVTGNHKILFKKRTCLPDSSPIWPTGYRLTRADDLATSKARFKVPISGRQAASGIPLTYDEIRFIGWFLTDGTKNRQCVSVTQADHQPQIADLRACLVGCGFDFTETKRRPTYFVGSKTQTTFRVPNGTCAARPRRGWVKLEPYLDKNLSPLLEDMTEDQFNVLLHAIHLGDGSKRKVRIPTSYRITTGNSLFADRLQSLCVRRGFKCSIGSRMGMKNPTIMLHIQKSNTLIIHGEHSVPGQTRLKVADSCPDERVWCVANPLETIVTRRNGKVTIIGNCWWRHGSLNSDRHWELDQSAYITSAQREERMREKKESEPIRCPACFRFRLSGAKCPYCGFESSTRSRMVVQQDGSLKEHTGDIFKARRVRMKPDTLELWKRTYYRAKHSRNGMTFRQAEGLFFYENHYYPPRDLPLMPTNDGDWFRRVRDVDPQRLSVAFQEASQ